MKPGDVILVRFPQTDLEVGKLRPALLVAMSPGRRSDVLLTMITSQIHQSIAGFDEVVEPTDKDYLDTGLKTRSVIRLSRLATVDNSVINARLGEISDERLHEVKRRLIAWLEK